MYSPYIPYNSYFAYYVYCAYSAWAAPRGRQTLANPHELASNEECTRTCCGRACWNGTGTARNPASGNGSGRYIHKYAKNMQLYVKICLRYIQAVLVKYEKIYTKYARNMRKYAHCIQ